MKLSLESIKILDAIERRGSFSLAAQELERATSSVTYAVQKLEADLDVLIFDRSGHRARLTPAGRLLLDEGRRLLVVAQALEHRVLQTAHGWEPQFTLAVDAVLPWAPVTALLAEFYGEAVGTRLVLRHEALAGGWDALLSGDADLVLGAPAPGPAGGGYKTRPLPPVEFVFAVAPHHPLARATAPLSAAAIEQHRAVAIADTARRLPVRTVGLLDNQEVLTVPHLGAKVAAQVAGLGVGWLPRWAAEPEIRAGRLVEKAVADRKNPTATLFLAWRADASGRALQWFLRKLRAWSALDQGAQQATRPA